MAALAFLLAAGFFVSVALALGQGKMRLKKAGGGYRTVTREKAPVEFYTGIALQSLVGLTAGLSGAIALYVGRTGGRIR